MRLSYFEGLGMDPYENLAMEERLVDICGEGEAILYLWQNDRTVVIGRNQDAAAECPLDLLARDGVRLARRNSGGGAVYHDAGNLNFSIICREFPRGASMPRQKMPRQKMPRQKQKEIVLRALSSLGIEASASGRNDVTAGGGKVSGFAYYARGSSWCGHGTLMVDVDLESLQKYLFPKRGRQMQRGVASEVARVKNLRDINPDIGVGDLMRSLRASFEGAFCGKCCESALSDSDLSDIRMRRERFASDAWIYGKWAREDRAISRRFGWGRVTLRFRVKNGVISGLKAETDAMDPGLADALRERLIGVPLDGDNLKAAFSGNDGGAGCHPAGSGEDDARELMEIGEWLGGLSFGGSGE